MSGGAYEPNSIAANHAARVARYNVMPEASANLVSLGFKSATPTNVPAGMNMDHKAALRNRSQSKRAKTSFATGTSRLFGLSG